MARPLTPLAILPACAGIAVLAAAALAARIAEAAEPATPTTQATSSETASRTPSDRTPVLTARWLPSCEPSEQYAYITVRVHADGTVQYVGAKQVAEVGERSTRIKPYDARYLARRASDFIRAPAPPARYTSQRSRPDMCMEFETVVDGAPRVRRESIETRASKVFANDIARKVPLRSWACPGRETPDEPDRSIDTFCDQWQRR